MDFASWESEYMEWRDKAAPILGADVPADLGPLQLEAQRLEPLRFAAERHRAAGASYYYGSKLREWEDGKAQGLAVSSLDGYAKARAFRALWFMEDALGHCEAIKSRQIRVSTLLRQEDKP